MNIISLHSHKGGVGKSTFCQLLCKYLAHIKKQKTCLVDFDFQAPGLRSTYLRKYLEYDLSDLLLNGEDKKEDVIKKLAVKDEEINNLYFIANRYKPLQDIKTQRDIKRKMFLKMANEIYTNEITDDLKQVLRHLEALAFKHVIIDCHPGLVLLSEEVIRETKSKPIFVTTPDIISFIGMFQTLILQIEGWNLSLPDLNIIINRVSEDFTLENAVEQFLHYQEITMDEVVACSTIKEKFINQKSKPMMLLKENEEIRNMDTLLNPNTLLSMDLPADFREAMERLLPEA